ncbi:MAG TPA: hypothetical protein PLQ98_00070 [Bacillota bacterium]|nr:hypothetical protein [Bacillota bacterium]
MAARSKEELKGLLQAANRVIKTLVDEGYEVVMDYGDGFDYPELIAQKKETL